MSKDSKSSYYDQGGHEVLDIIKAKLTPEQYRGYLLGNILKYACRLNWKSSDYKGQKRDAEKCSIYSKWLMESFKKVEEL